jgi:hypothetical protein
MVTASAPSPVTANFFMEDFKEVALNWATHNPSSHGTSCYMDDTFIIWPHGPNKLRDFFSNMNSVHQNIHLPFPGIIISAELMAPWAIRYTIKNNNQFSVTM